MAPCHHPRNGHLGRGGVHAGGQLLQHLHQRLIFNAVVAGKTRQVRTEVAGARGLRASQQPARQHAVRRDADTQFLQHRKDRGVRPAADQRVFDLQVSNRVHGVRPLDGVCAHLAQADVPYITGLHQVGHGTDGVFDRHGRVEPGHAVDVDVVRAQPLQAVGQKVFDRRRPAIHAGKTPCRVAQRAKLHRQQRLVAPALQSLANQGFVVAHAIKVAGVDQVDTSVHRGVNGGHALRVVAGAVHGRHAHAAQADD